MNKEMEKSSENGMFLDGRDYTASELYKTIALLVGNGVYSNELTPTATNENMTITHGTGHAWINGVVYMNSTPFVLDIATADGSLNRYDSLMLRLNLSINEVYAIIVQGAYATTPQPPACTRNAETFDLKICDIYVPAGCTKITQDQITDTRLDSSVCGVPVFPVEHLDMTSFYRQISADLLKFREDEEAGFAAWVAEQEDTNMATMTDLVEAVRDTSDESRAEILALLQQLNTLVDSDTVGTLIAQINNAVKKSGDTMTGDLNMGGHADHWRRADANCSGHAYRRRLVGQRPLYPNRCRGGGNGRKATVYHADIFRGGGCGYCPAGSLRGRELCEAGGRNRHVCLP